MPCLRLHHEVDEITLTAADVIHDEPPVIMPDVTLALCAADDALRQARKLLGGATPRHRRARRRLHLLRRMLGAVALEVG